MNLLDFIIPVAWAQAQPASPGGSLIGLMPLVILFIIMWFMLIRPQMKRAKEHRKMVEALAKGDEVVTQGGVLGKIVELGENFVLLEIADGVQVKVQRHMISSTMPKGTAKTL
jgi:preprotein translocase subunit YajC